MGTELDLVKFYRDAAGEWRWRYQARNGRTLADSGEGYQKFSACVESASIVVGLKILPIAVLKDHSSEEEWVYGLKDRGSDSLPERDS